MGRHNGAPYMEHTQSPELLKAIKDSEDAMKALKEFLNLP